MNTVKWGLVVFVPRSLSSVTMRVLTRMDWPALQSKETVDGPVALPVEANVFGYYEHRAVQSPDSSIAIQALQNIDLFGLSVKVRALNVPPILAAGLIPTWALVLRRPIEHSEASWNYAFAGKRLVKTWAEIEENVDRAYDALVAAGVSTLNVDVLRIIGDPEQNIEADTTAVMTEIAAHVGISIDRVPEMVSMIDQNIPYRWRQK